METSIDPDRVNLGSSLSREEIIEMYINMKDQLKHLGLQYDVSQQELHDLKRNNQFSSELKDHLQSEIETLQKNETKLKIEYEKKYSILQEDIEHLKDVNWKETENVSNTIESLQSEIAKLKQFQVTNTVDENVSFDNSKMIEEIRQQEEEINVLKLSNTELKKQLTILTESLALSELHKEEIETLKEQVHCLKSNLESKKEELSSVTDMLHSTQDDLCLANAELQQFKISASNFAPKGNSLFAEVDDKRQEMLKSLSQMKDKVYQLNRELVSKQAEVDSLLCEKKTLWEEYAGQSNHHDAVLNRAYERRITDLEKQTDQLHRDIARWYDKNIDPSSSEAAQWLSGVLEHYRKENARLSNELTACSVNNLSLEQKLRELQRQIVTWRTKAMEARASVSELQTKLQLAEKCAQIANSTNVDVDLTHLEKTVTADGNNVKEESDNTFKEGFREINVSNIPQIEDKKDDSLKVKDSSPVIPGILVANGNENRVPKKTSFK